MKGIELLVEGRSVKTVAAEVGYRQQSAFVELFRQTFGMTPRTWIAALEAQDLDSFRLADKPKQFHGALQMDRFRSFVTLARCHRIA
jgi:AraC-like DNA-binding protein